MPLRVEDICYHLMKLGCVKMKIEAGKPGLKHFVLRVVSAENKNTAALVEKYDIAFVSGQYVDALILAQTVLERGASAIVLNSGTCSADTRRLIAGLCVESDTALIEIAEYGHFAVAMDLFEYEVACFEKKQAKMKYGLQNVLIFQDKPTGFASIMERYADRRNLCYCVSVLKFVCKDDKPLEENILSQAERFAEIGMNEVAAETTAVCVGSRMALIFDGKAPETVRRATEVAVVAIPHQFRDRFHIYIGVGRRCMGIENIYESFTTASKAASIQTVRKRENAVLPYEELGISKLLMEIDSRSCMANDFYCETIKPLVEYDKRNGTDLVNFLRLYFEHSGRIKEIGEELYMHRNSVNYKVNKISEIVGRDLSDTYDRSELLVALRLFELSFGDEML